MEIGTKIRLLAGAIVVVLALIQDIRSYKISNGTVAGALIIAVLINIIEGVSGYESVSNGYIVKEYFAAGLIAFAITFVMYLLRAIGAADAKLISVIGLLVGVKSVIHMIVISVIAGGVLGIIYMVFNKAKLLTCDTHDLNTVGILSHLSVAKGIKRLHGFHYSIAIALAYVSVIVNLII